MCLLNCARVDDHLHNSETRPRSPFDRSNFVCLSSALRISGFHNNWMENRCWVVLKRWSVVTYKDLQRQQKWSEGAFSIIFVEIPGHELRTVRRRSKLKNKVWHSLVIAVISRCLKGQTNKLKYATVLFTKTTRIHSERSLIVSPEILHTERDELAPFCKFIFMILRCCGPHS